MLDFEISKESEDTRHAVRPDLAVTVQGSDGVLFHRRAIKLLSSGEEQRDSMLVARLGDVSVYIADQGIIISREDLYL